MNEFIWEKHLELGLVPKKKSIYIYTYTHTHTHTYTCFGASSVAQMVKRLPGMWETWVQSLGQEDPLGKEMATYSSTFAWKNPWTEEPGRLSPWSCKESDTTKRLHFHFSGGNSGRGSACHCRGQKRCGFDLWVGKIPWRRAWQPTPGFWRKS